jgi:hypothetical protein
MELGVVCAFDASSLQGQIMTPDGRIYTFDYARGQNMMSGRPTPQFTGRHEQPAGFRLKHPSEGDVVAFARAARGAINTWGYVYHFMDLVERQYGRSSAKS